MDKQNITLSIPEEVLRKIKILATQRKITVSQLLTEALERLIQAETDYEEARRRQLDWLEHGFNLGLGNNKPASREDLHKRT
jgi:hypothetical protein